MTFVPSKNPRKQRTQTPADSEQQTVDNRQTQHCHMLFIPEPPQWPLSFPELHCWERGFCATTAASKSIMRAVHVGHHSNIEIDSNESLFFLRKTMNRNREEVSQSCNSLFTPEKQVFFCFTFYLIIPFSKPKCNN